MTTRKLSTADRQRLRHPNSFLMLIYNPTCLYKDRFSIDGTNCIYSGQAKATLYDNLLPDNTIPAYMFIKERQPIQGDAYTLLGKAIHRTNPQARDTNIIPEYHFTIDPTNDLQKLRNPPPFTKSDAKTNAWYKEKLLNDYGLIKLSGNFDQGVMLVTKKKV